MQASCPTSRNPASPAASRALFHPVSVIIGLGPRGVVAPELLAEGEGGEIFHPVEKEDAVEMVGLVLSDAGGEV